MATHKIALLAGDGIGQEVVPEARKVLEDYFAARVKERRNAEGTDMLTVLCHTSDEDANTFSDEDIVNHIIFVMMAVSFFVARKASEFGKNPGFAAAKMMASLNPNVEVVKADENTGKITLRDKQTGKTVTLDFEDIQKGRISFEGEGGEKAVIQGEGEGGTGSMTIKGPDGSMQFGQGSLANVPSWVPRYPGAQAVGAFTSQQGGEEGGTFQLQCSGSVEEVAAFYERELKSAGMKAQKTSVEGDNRTVITLVGTDEARQHTVTVTAGTSDKGTVADIMYMIKK